MLIRDLGTPDRFGYGDFSFDNMGHKPYDEQEESLLCFILTKWDNLQPKFDTIQAIIDARKKCNLTQKQLAERTGIDQADISKIETGNANPTLQMLKRLAEGMDMVLKIEFIPKQKVK